MNTASPFPRIIHLSTGKSLRGGERQAALLHQGLLAKGRESRLVCRAASELSGKNIPALTPVPWAGEWDLWGLRRLLGECISYGASIIHCHDAHAFSHGSVIGARLKIPVVYTRRVVFPLHSDLFSTWKYRQCRMVIAVSNAVARQCRTLVPGDRIIVIPDSSDWTRPLLSKTEARSALHIPEKCFVFGSVGHFTREKNLPMIVSLAQALRRTNPEARIVCIGPIHEPVGTLDNLVCTGSMPDAVNFYNAFDAYISASTHEGLGSALLDAIVRDIPSLAIDGGGTRDLFPEQWPLIPPPDQAGFIAGAREIADNISLAREKAEACGKRARAVFSADSVIKKTIDVYDKLALPGVS